MLERYVIHVTKQCNMNCFYCYEQDKTSTYTTEEVIELVHNLAENCHDKQFGIEFLGGEPMLGFNNIIAVYDYLEKTYPGRVTDYVITTNGTVLDDEQKSFLKQHPNMIYAVSLDGTRWANQFRRYKNGQNVFEDVIENLKWAVDNLPAQQVNVHMVTHPFNVGNIENSIRYLYSIGVRGIGVGTVESTMMIDEAYCDRFVKEMAKISHAIKNGELAGLFVDILNHLKPREDVRTYIKDPKTGKTVGESYGRAKDDMTHKNIPDYNSVQTASPIEDMIYNLRKCVYDNHQYIMQGDKNAKRQ